MPSPNLDKLTLELASTSMVSPLIPKNQTNGNRLVEMKEFPIRKKHGIVAACNTWPTATSTLKLTTSPPPTMNMINGCNFRASSSQRVDFLLVPHKIASTTVKEEDTHPPMAKNRRSSISSDPATYRRARCSSSSLFVHKNLTEILIEAPSDEATSTHSKQQQQQPKSNSSSPRFFQIHSQSNSTEKLDAKESQSVNIRNGSKSPSSPPINIANPPATRPRFSVTSMNSIFSLKRNGTGATAAAPPRTPSITSQFSQQVRATKTVGLITVFFLLCWLPFLVMWPWKIYCNDCISDTVYLLSICANYLNSTLNPVLYTLCSPRFRAFFRRYFLKSCSSRDSLTTKQIVAITNGRKTAV